MLVTANIFQPLIDVFQRVIKFFHNNLGVSWGWSIVLLTICVRLVLVPLTIKQFHSMRQAAAPAAADEGDPAEVQGRQAAPAGRDDEVLPGERRQPARVLPPAGRAVAGLHLAVLHAAQEPARTTSARPSRPAFQAHYAMAHHHPSSRRARRSARRRGARTTHAHYYPAARIPLHPRHHEHGERRRRWSCCWSCMSAPSWRRRC